MITGTLKNQIDKIWDDMYSYGLANPLTVIDQLTSLFFIKSLDDNEIANEKKAALLPGAKMERVFPADEEGQLLRWSKFSQLKAEEMHEILRDKVFPFIQTLQAGKDTAYNRFMKDAKFLLPSPLVTEKVVTAINDLPLNDNDLKGDLYEYMISKLQTAGRIGQFRTPRHIIRMMVELMDPQMKDVIAEFVLYFGVVAGFSSWLGSTFASITRTPCARIKRRGNTIRTRCLPGTIPTRPCSALRP